MAHELDDASASPAVRGLEVCGRLHHRSPRAPLRPRPRPAPVLHLIALDHLAFGHSDAPPVTEFDCTFDALTDLTQDLLGQLGVDRYVMYVRDYGARFGRRLALRDPAAVTTGISQSGNAYQEGFVPAFWKTVWGYWKEQTPETEAGVRQALTPEFTRRQYLTGAADETPVDPGTWQHDHALLSRPGNDLVQLKPLLDYATNPPLYPVLHRLVEYEVRHQ
ncbi:alpha/beta fold hydrolase [Streptomyces sp. NBC_01478]|uniref:alpha/beta fold hydrolase n=1 Tax=Streptomyces sp. NBC_01478 TaxID=2903882 RepID=UPI003FCE74EE